MTQPDVDANAAAGPDAGDDQQWLDLLAGRAAPEADARTRKQAAWLRAALLSYRHAAPAGGPAPADERIARLLARARAAGVLASEVGGVPVGRPAAVAAGRAAPANRWRYAVAASVVLGAAVLVVAPGRFGQDGGQDGAGQDAGSSTLRGAAVQRIEAADPAQRRTQLLAALRAAGFDAQPFDRLGRAGIDVELPVPLPAAQAAALVGMGIQPPAGPSLQIDIVAPVPGR